MTGQNSAGDQLAYEIEIRFCAPTAEAAYMCLPFLEASLGAEKPWSTHILSRPIFEAGKLLRIGYVPPTGKPAEQRVYLGYKGTDEGLFANIRQEWGEEITDGTIDSEILKQLGVAGVFPTAQAVRDALSAQGHTPFMAFAGVDRLGIVHNFSFSLSSSDCQNKHTIAGTDAEFTPEQQNDLHTKLMRCPKILGDQVMVELELTAASLAEALSAERKLQQLADQYEITDRLLRDEPPTLLYQVSFPK